jgi:hypothetical protein
VPVELRLTHVCNLDRDGRLRANKTPGRGRLNGLYMFTCDSFQSDLTLRTHSCPSSEPRTCSKCGEPCKFLGDTAGQPFDRLDLGEAPLELDLIARSRQLIQCRLEISLESEHRLNFFMRPNESGLSNDNSIESR